MWCEDVKECGCEDVRECGCEDVQECGCEDVQGCEHTCANQHPSIPAPAHCGQPRTAAAVVM